MTIQNEGIGYKDLDELFSKPCDLEFIIGENEKRFTKNKVFCSNFAFLFLYFAEIISIEQPNEYEKESWQLNDNEKSKTISEYRESGNELYRNGKIEEAEEKYRSALAIVEPLLLKYELSNICK